MGYYYLIWDIRIEGNRTYVSFGIACAAVPESESVVIHDITTDYKRLGKLVKDCNEYQLDPIHLPDVVEDFLAE